MPRLGWNEDVSGVVPVDRVIARSAVAAIVVESVRASASWICVDVLLHVRPGSILARRLDEETLSIEGRPSVFATETDLRLANRTVRVDNYIGRWHPCEAEIAFLQQQCGSYEEMMDVLMPSDETPRSLTIEWPNGGCMGAFDVDPSVLARARQLRARVGDG